MGTRHDQFDHSNTDHVLETDIALVFSVPRFAGASRTVPSPPKENDLQRYWPIVGDAIIEKDKSPQPRDEVDEAEDE